MESQTLSARRTGALHGRVYAARRNSDHILCANFALFGQNFVKYDDITLNLAFQGSSKGIQQKVAVFTRRKSGVSKLRNAGMKSNTFFAISDFCEPFLGGNCAFGELFIFNDVMKK